MPEGEKMVISAAAKSGDGSVENVGIKVDGKFKSPVTNQLFDTQEALDLHLKYLHDPKKDPSHELPNMEPPWRRVYAQSVAYYEKGTGPKFDVDDTSICGWDLAHPDVKLMADETAPTIVSMSFCVGPAFSLLHKAWAVTAAIPVLTLLVGCLSASYNEHKVGVVTYWPFLLWMPMAAYHLFLELKVLRYSLIPYIQVREKFSLFSVCNLGVFPWVLLGFVQSIMNLVSAYTNSIFIAKLIITHKIKIEAVLCWFASFAPILWPLVMYGFSHLTADFERAVARYDKGTDENFVRYVNGAREELPRGNLQNKADRLPKHTIQVAKTKVTTGILFQSLASAALMGSVMRQEPYYAFLRAQPLVAQVEKAVRENRQDQNNHIQTPLLVAEKDIMVPLRNALQHLEGALSAAFGRLFLIGFMRNMLQANMQLTILSGLVPASSDFWHGMFGVVVLFAASVNKLLFAFKVLHIAFNIVPRPLHVLWLTRKKESPQRDDLKRIGWKVVRKVCGIICWATIFYTAFCYAVVHFWVLCVQALYADVK